MRGGQFKDLIQPIPVIDGLESDDTWGNDKVVPRDRDNGVEDNEWCYWGGNPVKGKDGNYHIAICRWPEANGHHGWHKSEVAHAVSDNPLGPYKVLKTIVEQGHNPEVMAMKDGTYCLHVLNRNRVYTASRMAGPWELLGSMRLESRGLRESNRLGSNLTTEFRPDGSILMMQKTGDVSISRNGILGPFKLVAIENYGRATGYPEDPVIWRSRHQYHAVYNHAQDRRSAYMRSLDGVHWKNEWGVPYDASTTYYTDGTKNSWYKFERPKVLQDESGRATHLTLAVMDVSKGEERGRDNHSSKNLIIPLATEKFVSIVGADEIGAETRRIAVLIEAEAGFDPASEVKLDSLRFGSDSVVNHGAGCRAVEAKKQGEDLLVTFEGDHGLYEEDYDFKLLGETNTGELLLGYALLPGRSPTAASLITLPIKVTMSEGKRVLKSAVENWGLEESVPVDLQVWRYSRQGETLVQTVRVDPIQAYGSQKIVVEFTDDPSEVSEYELSFAEPYRPSPRWRRVDDTSEQVVYEGPWTSRHDANDCHLKTEHATETLGAAVAFKFNGRRARVRGKIGAGMGSFDVFIDGEFIEQVRCNWGSRYNAPIYKTPLLEPGPHTLKLVKSKTRHNGDVTIDYFAYQ